MQDPETLSGVTRAGSIDHPSHDTDDAFIAPETPEVKSSDQHVLKAGDTFIVNDSLGDITGVDDGLFVNDTRVLSSLRLTSADACRRCSRAASAPTTPHSRRT
jgi:hypothetical protein